MQVLVHCAFCTVLVFLVEFAWEPNAYSATLLVRRANMKHT